MGKVSNMSNSYIFFCQCDEAPFYCSEYMEELRNANMQNVEKKAQGTICIMV